MRLGKNLSYLQNEGFSSAVSLIVNQVFHQETTMGQKGKRNSHLQKNKKKKLPEHLVVVERMQA